MALLTTQRWTRRRPQLAGFVCCFFAVAECERGELPSAVHHARVGVRTSVAMQARYLLSIGVQATMVVVSERADVARRARLLGAADTQALAIGTTFGAWERLPAGQGAAGLRERLEQEGWRAAYREGRSLPFGAVAALALRLLEEVAQTLPQPDTAGVSGSGKSPKDPAGTPLNRSHLTAREQEVLRLVSQGRSNAVWSSAGGGRKAWALEPFSGYCSGAHDSRTNAPT